MYQDSHLGKVAVVITTLALIWLKVGCCILDISILKHCSILHGSLLTAVKDCLWLTRANFIGETPNECDAPFGWKVHLFGKVCRIYNLLLAHEVHCAGCSSGVWDKPSINVQTCCLFVHKILCNRTLLGDSGELEPFLPGEWVDWPAILASGI